MSDLHLGARQSQTDKILKFLNENESETLILNGDIIDGWALKGGGKWKSNCSKIFRKFMKRSEKGTNVVYIRGNHDDFLKPFIPFNLNNISYLNIISILFYLIPFSLGLGSAVPDILLSIIASSFFIFILIKKYWKLLKNKFTFFFILFWIKIFLH